MLAKRNNIFFAIITLLLLIGCNKHKTIDKDTLSKVYVDIMIAQEIYLPNFDSLEIKKREIFKKYNITKEDYYNTLDSYQADTQKWDEFFKSSLTYLDTLRKQNLKQ